MVSKVGIISSKLLIKKTSESVGYAAWSFHQYDDEKVGNGEVTKDKTGKFPERGREREREREGSQTQSKQSQS